MIGWDYTPALKKGIKTGDFEDRLKYLANYFENIYVFALTPKNAECFERKKITENLEVFCIKTNPILFPIRVKKLAEKEIENIDVIISQDPIIAGIAGFLIKKIFNAKLIIELHGDYIDNQYWISEHPLRNRIFNFIAKILLKKADFIRVVSVKIERNVKKMGISRVANIPTGGGIDIERFSNTEKKEARKILRIEEDKKIVLFAGRLVKQKALDNLIYAVTQVYRKKPEVEFYIVGNGPEKNFLKKLSKKLGVDKNTIFLGAVPQEKMHLYYAASDVFVLPSNYEGLARVLEEAAASGLPIVTTDISGAEEAVIDNETGFIVELNNPEKIAEKVIYLLENPDKAQKMGIKGREIAREKFDREKNLIKYIELIKSAAEEK